MRFRRPGRRQPGTALVLALLFAACSDSGDRPSNTTWRDVWESRQALVPNAETILEQGEELCGERVGVFRTEMPALLPAPTEALDAAVDDWISHAETIVFECSDDADELADRFETLAGLSAEVDAGWGVDG